MIKTYTYKLYNNKSYQKKFDKWVGVCRMVYNLALETKIYAYKAHGKNLSDFDLMNQLPTLKKSYPFIKEVNAQTLQSVIERLGRAYQKFFSGAGFPKWAKKGKYKSFDFKQNVKETEKGFKLPSFGEVKVFNKKGLKGYKIKTARLLQEVDGIYVQIVCETENIKRKDNNQVCAIDMGISYFCVTSDGGFIDNPRFTKKYEKQLRIENRSLSRKKKGSNSWKKQAKKLAKLHLKIRRCRKDFLHKESTKLAADYDTIIRENLKVSNMTKNKKLAKHIYDCGWAIFFELLEYKANVVEVNPAYTSQTCPKCKSIHKENRPTQSLFECIECGHTDNADKNASKNILELGHQLMYAKVGQ